MRGKGFGVSEMASTVKIEELSIELSDILQDYDNYEVNGDNVVKWINQFDEVGMTKKEMIIILEELIRIFKLTYFSKDKISKFFSNIILKEFESKNISFLDIQQYRESDKYKSSSQSDYISLFKSIDSRIKVNDFKADI